MSAGGQPAGSRTERILVCGGAGFIGSHLVERLVASGRDVDVVDDLSTGSLAHLSVARDGSGRMSFQNAALSSAGFAEIVSVRRPDVVVNVASFSPARCTPSGALAALGDCLAVLEAARLSGASRVVTALPAGLLYGEIPAKESPVKEGSCAEPRSVEEVLARAAADAHGVYRDRHGIEFVVLAMSNVYGPRQRPEDGVVATFARCLVDHRPPVIHGTGNQIRDFVHVDDAVDALVRATEHSGGLVINVGTGVGTTVADLWRMMAGRAALVPRTTSPRPHDLLRLVLSPVRARIQLGWSPFTSLAQGLPTVR